MQLVKFTIWSWWIDWVMMLGMLFHFTLHLLQVLNHLLHFSLLYQHVDDNCKKNENEQRHGYNCRIASTLEQNLKKTLKVILWSLVLLETQITHPKAIQINSCKCKSTVCNITITLISNNYSSNNSPASSEAEHPLRKILSSPIDLHLRQYYARNFLHWREKCISSSSMHAQLWFLQNMFVT